MRGRALSRCKSKLGRCCSRRNYTPINQGSIETGGIRTTGWGAEIMCKRQRGKEMMA